MCRLRVNYPPGARSAFLLCLLWPFAAIGSHAAEITGPAIHTVDGDTFDIRDGTRIVRVRVCGIDAPEFGQPGYEAASQAMRRLISGKTVRCIQVGGGTPCDGRSKASNQGRIVAQCFVDGGDIAVP